VSEPMPMISRADAAPMMPEQVNTSTMPESRRRAAVRAHVGGDGKVRHQGQQVIGTVHKTSGLAWRARDPKGNVIGLHSSKAEAAGALVLRHESGT
jgi:hypothetical protein